MPDTIRIGIIGAGSFTKTRILPGFQKLPHVRVTLVANRSRASAEKVASEFGIPAVADDWRRVIESPEVDAVFIGTPPYLHKEAAIAALDAGKHVLCETRIAMSAAEAIAMKEKADEAAGRGVRAMLVPPAPFFRGRRFIQHLVQSGYIGRLRQVQGFNMNTSFADPSTPLTVGRNDMSLYGRYNAAQLGLSYDVMVPWTGYAVRVLAQRATFTPQRPVMPGGPLAPTPYPDAVTVLAETESGAVAMNLLNWAAYFGESRMELYGEEGSIVYRQRGDAILAGRKGDDQLSPLDIPPEYDGVWQCEEEFARLVSGEIEQPSFTFQDGVRNMQYLEAAYHSALEGRWAALP